MIDIVPEVYCINCSYDMYPDKCIYLIYEESKEHYSAKITISRIILLCNYIISAVRYYISLSPLNCKLQSIRSLVRTSNRVGKYET